MPERRVTSPVSSRCRPEPAPTHSVFNDRLGRAPKRRRAFGNTAGERALARFVHVIVRSGAAPDRVVEQDGLQAVERLGEPRIRRYCGLELVPQREKFGGLRSR